MLSAHLDHGFVLRTDVVNLHAVQLVLLGDLFDLVVFEQTTCHVGLVVVVQGLQRLTSLVVDPAVRAHGRLTCTFRLNRLFVNMVHLEADSTLFVFFTNGKVFLRLIKQFAMHGVQGLLALHTGLRVLGLLLFLEVHDHLQIRQLLRLLQVVNRVDEGLFAHLDDPFADVVDNFGF